MHNTDIPPKTAKKLAQYRKEINAIDQKLIALFKERIGIVTQVGAMKRSETDLKCFIRSGREAQMLRDIYHQFADSDFNPLAAATIWRQIIAASTHTEQPLTVSLNSHHPELLWLAQEYFGRFAAFTERFTNAEIFEDIVVSHSNIAVMTYPADSPECWWHDAAISQSDLRVFACLPFIETDDPHALALARLLPEPTGDDLSLLTFTARDAATITAISTCFQQYRITHHLLANRGELVLFRLDGYFTPDHQEIRQLQLDLGEKISHIHWLGSYARPLQLNS